MRMIVSWVFSHPLEEWANYIDKESFIASTSTVSSKLLNVAFDLFVIVYAWERRTVNNEQWQRHRDHEQFIDERQAFASRSIVQQLDTCKFDTRHLSRQRTEIGLVRWFLLILLVRFEYDEKLDRRYYRHVIRMSVRASSILSSLPDSYTWLRRRDVNGKNVVFSCSIRQQLALQTRRDLHIENKQTNKQATTSDSCLANIETRYACLTKSFVLFETHSLINVIAVKISDDHSVVCLVTIDAYIRLTYATCVVRWTYRWHRWTSFDLSCDKVERRITHDRTIHERQRRCVWAR
jgi:hypothetical protein